MSYLVTAIAVVAFLMVLRLIALEKRCRILERRLERFRHRAFDPYDTRP